jgi:hypothetical protein
MRDYKEYELIQFTERGKIYTYLPDYPISQYPGMDISCIFKVKLKDNRTWFQKTFLNWRWLRYWPKHLISSQINKVLCQ